jgi:tRNA-modifying protein YgfZ
MTLQNLHRSQGATLAADGIPLHYGDVKAEYQAALERVVLMDRSHEGRLESSGRDRLELIQRISTNDVLGMANNEGRPTILTTATGRIIDRLMVYERGEKALITTEPGRGEAVKTYLQRQIFFNDDIQIRDLMPNTQQFALHGPAANQMVNTFVNEPQPQTGLMSYTVIIGGYSVILAQRKAVSGGHWVIIVPSDAAETVWNALMEAGKVWGIRAAGSLTYNVLRIRAGRPGAGRELTTDYIPLEAGLWDEVSFSKGCYTGQEIIARMESRNRLAKTMVKLRLEKLIEAPTRLFHEGAVVGTLTSSIMTPDGETFGIGFVKVSLAEPEQQIMAGEQGIEGVITELAGAQPPMLQEKR